MWYEYELFSEGLDTVVVMGSYLTCLWQRR